MIISYVSHVLMKNIKHIKDYNFYKIGIIQSNPKIEYMRNNKPVSFDKEGWDSFK